MRERDVVEVFGNPLLEPCHELPDPRRADAERLHREVDAVSRSPLVEALLAAANATLLVLNEQRQIVALNGRGLRAPRPSDLLGLRIGEAFGCVHALAARDCGVTPACARCGALAALLGCQRLGQPVDTECLLSSASGAALEFEVRASPAVIGGSRFTVVSLRDITTEKRRRVLEQVFFHDVLNTVTGLRGWAELLRLSNGGHPGAPERIERLSRHLEREICDHRALVLAEDGSLVPRPERLHARDVLREVANVFDSNVVARGRRLEQELGEEVELESDPSLVQRVLVNMVRNALEATEPGGVVRVRCERIAGAAPEREDDHAQRVRFSVWNHGVMPLDVQARVFQRSFSTKSRHGRGFGTYSMRLLAESYLGGKVSFISDAESGTVFRLDLPVVAPARSPDAPADAGSLGNRDGARC
jgi:signal transduction histidine kinase